MSTRKHRVQSAFARAAATYDAHVSIQRQVVAELAHQLPQSEPYRVLEIGCGTGNYTQVLREKFPQAQLTALDFCEEMIEVAQRKLGPAAEPIRWRVADGETYTPAADELPYDLITSTAAFQWFDDLGTALARYRTWLAPGGSLCFSQFVRGTFHELQAVWGDAFPEAQVPAAGFLTADDLRAIVHASGFTAKLRSRMWQLTFLSLVELLRHFRATGTSGLPKQSRTLSPAALRRLEADWRHRFGEISLTYEAWFVTAEPN